MMHIAGKFILCCKARIAFLYSWNQICYNKVQITQINQNIQNDPIKQNIPVMLKQNILMFCRFFL